jgi:hypothetical protein
MARTVSRQALTEDARGSIPGQSMWDLWWTKWYWDMFLSEYIGFPPIAQANSVTYYTILVLEVHHIVNNTL